MNERQVHRPFYLVAAMVLLWIVGMESVLAGVSTALTLREGALPDVAEVARLNADSGPEAFFPVFSAARIAALGAVSQLAFPLGVAKALLASTLVLASTMVLAGRPTARTFAFQAILVNALFAVAEYVALRHVRASFVDMTARAVLAVQDPAAPGAATFEMVRTWGFSVERMRLVFLELGVPLLAMLALTRQRTKVFFAEAAAAAQSAEEEP